MRRSIPSAPRMCRCPTTSSILRGLISSANGLYMRRPPSGMILRSVRAFCKLRHNMLAQQQPRACRHPYQRTGHASAPRRRRFELARRHRLLRAVERCDAPPRGCSSLAHHARQRAAARFRYVRYLQQRRVALLPVPRADMMGMPRSRQDMMRSTLHETRSIASTT